MKRLGRSLFYCAKMKCFKRFFNWLSKKNRKTFIKEGDAVLNVHNVLQLSNFFLKDLEKLREFSEMFKNRKLLEI